MSSDLTFFKTGQHDCSYLPDKQAETLFLDPEAEQDPALIELLNLNGFRRSGNHVYRPDCPNCNGCQSVRIVVADFVRTRSFQRVLRKNDDVQIKITRPAYSEEHYQLYERYLSERHQDGDMYPPSKYSYTEFLLTPQRQARLVEFRIKGRLIAASVIDLFRTGPSAIYTYFDPDDSDRSLGTLAILFLVELASAHNLPFVYLGYWIKNSTKMLYKERFQPLQVFRGQQWQPWDKKG